MTLNRSALRLSRLLTLLSTLSETARPLTARELREKLEGYSAQRPGVPRQLLPRQA